MIENIIFKMVELVDTKKIPLYLKYCDLDPTPELITSYINKFSDLVTRLVIYSDWVPGVLFL